VRSTRFSACSLHGVIGLCALLSALFWSPAVRACEPEGAALSGYGVAAAPWDRLPCNTLQAFAGENLALHFAAILGTLQLSQSGEDHAIRVWMERRFGFRPYSNAAVLAGYLGVPMLAVGLYFGGLLSKHKLLAGAGAAAIQAVTLTVLGTMGLKMLTGRPYPTHGTDPEAQSRYDHPDWAREWTGPSFGIPAWPSGHTSVSVSLASALTAYYTDSVWVPFLAYPAAGAVAFGMLSGGHHWFSDVFAGAILGHAIGWSVGRNFRAMQGARTHTGFAMQVLPGPFPVGISVGGAF
jgi:membrane-associated phospholipid phosphatase